MIFKWPWRGALLYLPHCAGVRRRSQNVCLAPAHTVTHIYIWYAWRQSKHCHFSWWVCEYNFQFLILLVVDLVFHYSGFSFCPVSSLRLQWVEGSLDNNKDLKECHAIIFSAAKQLLCCCLFVSVLFHMGLLSFIQKNRHLSFTVYTLSHSLLCWWSYTYIWWFHHLIVIHKTHRITAVVFVNLFITVLSLPHWLIYARGGSGLPITHAASASQKITCNILNKNLKVATMFASQAKA